MKTKLIENWVVSNKEGKIVRIEEENLFDCCIRGETVVGNCFWFTVITSPLKEMYKDYILTVNNHVYLLGDTNTTYFKLFSMDKAKLCEIVTKKLHLV